jgi:iron complex outermembrane receptor protein
MYANSNLKAEKLLNYDLGFSNRLLKDRLSLELVLFLVEGENLIMVQEHQGVRQYHNSGTFQNKGIEFSGSLSASDNLLFTTNYSYINMRTAILGTPEHNLYLSGRYQLNKIGLMFSYQYISGLYTQTDPASTSSYNLLNSKLSFTLNDYLDAFLKVENILNQSYEINYGYPMPGIIAFIGINIHTK